MRNIISNLYQAMKSYEEIILFVSLIILAISLPFSESVISISSGVILLQTLITGRWRAKGLQMKKDRSILLLVSIFLLFLLGLAFTRDLSLGLYELKKNLFWILLPLGIALSPKLSEKRFWWVIFIFVVAVTLSSFVSFVKLIFHDYFHIVNFREVSYVSHIAFSLQIAFALGILSYSLFFDSSIFKSIPRIILVTWIVWLIVFLILLKSILGLISFYVLALFFLIILNKYIANRNWRFFLKAFFLFVLLAPICYVGYAVLKFYEVKDPAPNQVEQYTIQGHKYEFDFNNQTKENGYYVDWFICEDELRVAWNQRSLIQYDSVDSSGYPIRSTLKRYITSKGLKKDANGLAQLTDQDIRNIEEGCANYIYKNKILSFYSRIYETIWELDQYYNFGNPTDQSLSQRIEFTKAAFYIIKNHFWGIGTGNFESEYAKAYQSINSQLSDAFYFQVHNQYLNYLVKFGIFGFLWIIFVFGYTIKMKGQTRNYLLWFLMVIFIVANFGGSNFETHVGLSFFLLFYVLLLWHSPNQVQKVIPESFICK